LRRDHNRTKSQSLIFVCSQKKQLSISILNRISSLINGCPHNHSVIALTHDNARHTPVNELIGMLTGIDYTLLSIVGDDSEKGHCLNSNALIGLAFRKRQHGKGKSDKQEKNLECFQLVILSF
jgi:hypothetical protein